MVDFYPCTCRSDGHVVLQDILLTFTDIPGMKLPDVRIVIDVPDAAQCQAIADVLTTIVHGQHRTTWHLEERATGQRSRCHGTLTQVHTATASCTGMTLAVDMRLDVEAPSPPSTWLPGN